MPEFALILAALAVGLSVGLKLMRSSLSLANPRRVRFHLSPRPVHAGAHPLAL
ncbi:MAG: hypothetical protein KGZ67_07915 [Hydrogenophaga sp.]|jgi:hypothetical protein|nr:hypothetical protein [Hydrogenophaga sp.]